MWTTLLLRLLSLSYSGDFDQIIKQAHVALTKFDPESARALSSQACQPEDRSVRTAICEAETGVIEEAAAHADAAELRCRRALSIWSQLAPDHAAYHTATLMNLGSLYRAQRRSVEAENMLTRAFDLARHTGDDRLLAVVGSRPGGYFARPRRFR